MSMEKNVALLYGELNNLKSINCLAVLGNNMVYLYYCLTTAEYFSDFDLACS